MFRLPGRSCNNLLKNLEEEDYNKAISYIEFLADRRKKQISDRKFAKDMTDVEAILTSLTGSIPDTGKSLAEYKNAYFRAFASKISSSAFYIGVVLKIICRYNRTINYNNFRSGNDVYKKGINFQRVPHS